MSYHDIADEQRNAIERMNAVEAALENPLIRLDYVSPRDPKQRTMLMVMIAMS